VYGDAAAHNSQEIYFGYRPTEGRIYDLASALEREVNKVAVFQIAGKQSLGDSQDAKIRCTHRNR